MVTVRFFVLLCTTFPLPSPTLGLICGVHGDQHERNQRPRVMLRVELDRKCSSPVKDHIGVCWRRSVSEASVDRSDGRLEYRSIR